jgi:hypothetical protein
MKYTLTLEGKKEFYPNLNNKTYNILLVDTKIKIVFIFCLFLGSFLFARADANVDDILKAQKDQLQAKLNDINKV